MKLDSTTGTRPRSAAEINTTIRRSRADDAYALDRLAQLDSGRYDGGAVLLAEYRGELLAAKPLGGGGRSFADPFRPTSELVALLELRAAQLDGATRVQSARPSRLRRLLRAVRRPPRYRAHA